MTVRELIEELEEYDESLDVVDVLEDLGDRLPFTIYPEPNDNGFGVPPKG